jgi:hypothetical protein
MGSHGGGSGDGGDGGGVVVMGDGRNGGEVEATPQIACAKLHRISKRCYAKRARASSSIAFWYLREEGRDTYQQYMQHLPALSVPTSTHLTSSTCQADHPWGRL